MKGHILDQLSVQQENIGRNRFDIQQLASSVYIKNIQIYDTPRLSR